MLTARSKQIRRDTILLMKNHSGRHYGGSFSCVEIMAYLFDQLLGSNDRFILSKGHGCWAYYVLLREQGFSPTIEGHPHYEPENGIYCTAGSMGHGFPTGIGMAFARKISGGIGKVVVLVGDGECQEGTTWESILIAGKHNLDNLIVIVDENGIQGSGFVNDILPVSKVLIAAAEAAGWSTISIDGHNEEILNIDLMSRNSPLLVVAKTVKGKGVSFMENDPKWHSNWLPMELEEKALSELT
jgi:transketolase